VIFVDTDLSDTAFYVPEAEQVPGMQLTRQGGKLYLDIVELEGQPLCVDFFDPGFLHRLKTSGLSMDVAKACGLKRGKQALMPSILDLTAGLGSDAVTLAYLGATVTMLERNPYVFPLLKDGLTQGRHQDISLFTAYAPDKVLNQLKDALLTRCNLLDKQDSAQFLQPLESNSLYDVIYFDPMFPERKKSAKVKKNMQYFHAVVGEDEAQEAKILQYARQKAAKRVVVKRPKQAEYIDGQKPSYSVDSKALRFDIYLC